MIPEKGQQFRIKETVDHWDKSKAVRKGDSVSFVKEATASKTARGKNLAGSWWKVRIVSTSGEKKPKDRFVEVSNCEPLASRVDGSVRDGQTSFVDDAFEGRTIVLSRPSSFFLFQAELAVQ